MTLLYVDIGGTDAPDQNYDCLIETPTGYDPNRATPYPWFLACHGRDDAPKYWEGNLYTQIKDHFVNSGFIFVAPNSFRNSFGNQNAIDNIVDVVDYIKANYNVESKPTAGGFSMGGLVVENVLIRYPLLFKGVASLYPLTDLNGLWQPTAGFAVGYRSHINTAFSCNDATYPTATSGYDPQARLADIAGTGIIHKIWAGDSDPNIPLSQHTAFRDGVNTAAGETLVTLRTIIGGTHGGGGSIEAYIAEVDAFIDTLPLDPIVSTPTITRNGNQVTAEATVEGLLEGETPAFFYDTTTPDENSPQMPTATNPSGNTWQSTKDFAFADDIYKFKAGVERDGEWYWSEVKTTTLSTNYSLVIGTGLAKNAEARAKIAGPLRVPTETGTFYFGLVDATDPRASAIRINTGTLETPQIVAVER